MPVEAPSTLEATTLRVEDQSGNQLLNVGPYTSPQLNSVDLAYPNVRNVSTPISGSHGVSDTTQWFADRPITANLTLPAGPSADDAVDTLSQVVGAGRVVLYVQRPNWTAERWIVVRGSTFTCPPGVLRQAQIGWVAPYPLFQDSRVSTATLSPSGSVAGGVSFPLQFPMVFGGGLSPGAGLITVGGNQPAFPVIDIFGPCSDPLVRCTTTGQQISFPGFSLSGTDYLHIDMAARTVTLNADPNQSRYSRIDFSTLSWFALPVGSSVQVLFSANSAASSCQARLSWRSTYLL